MPLRRTRAFFPETSSTIRRSAEILRRGMLTVYPQLRDIQIEYVWGGTLDFAFDIMPTPANSTASITP